MSDTNKELLKALISLRECVLLAKGGFAVDDLRAQASLRETNTVLTKNGVMLNDLGPDFKDELSSPDEMMDEVHLEAFKDVYTMDIEDNQNSDDELFSGHLDDDDDELAVYEIHGIEIVQADVELAKTISDALSEKLKAANGNRTVLGEEFPISVGDLARLLSALNDQEERLMELSEFIQNNIASIAASSFDNDNQDDDNDDDYDYDLEN